MTQLAKYDAYIRVNCEATVKMIKRLSPYAVILATGSTPIRPASIPGIGFPGVLTFEDILRNRVYVENSRVAVIGSGTTGFETADFLCERGNMVTIVEMQDEIGKGVYVQSYLDSMDRLSKFDVVYMPASKLVSIQKGAAVIEDVKTGELSGCAVDCIVLALGVESDNTLQASLEEAFSNVITIGDAAEVGRIEGAVRSGFEAAWNLQ